jgi:hypothetical protein
LIAILVSTAFGFSAGLIPDMSATGLFAFFWLSIMPRIWIFWYFPLPIGVLLLYPLIVSLLVLTIGMVSPSFFEAPIAFNFFTIGLSASAFLLGNGYSALTLMILGVLDGATCLLGLYLGLELNSPTPILGNHVEPISKKDLLNRLKNNSAVLIFIWLFQLVSLTTCVSILSAFST